MSAVYTVGTISVTNGSDIVTGSGTAWVGVIQTGWQIKLPNGEIYWVRQVNSATQLQLENAYTGTSQSNQDYIAGPTGGIARALANKVQDLIGDFQSVVDNAGDGKFADGDLAQPGIRFIADEDTGFRRPSSNTLDVVTGGVQRARFSSSGMNLSGLLSGTAVTQSATDTTAGRLTKVRDYGWGVPTGSGPTNNPDINTPPASGAYTYTSNPDGFLPSIFGGVLSFRGSPSRYAQIAISTSQPASQMFFRQELDGVNADWNRLYHNNNILGTVSQSSGVPTGAIIERGSNANGEFVRFADGTLICHCADQSVTIDANSNQSVTFTLPAATNSTFSNGFTAGQNSGGAAQIRAEGRARADSSTSISVRFVNPTTDQQTSTVIATHIGRWV